MGRLRWLIVFAVLAAACGGGGASDDGTPAPLTSEGAGSEVSATTPVESEDAEPAAGDDAKLTTTTETPETEPAAGVDAKGDHKRSADDEPAEEGEAEGVDILAVRHVVDDSGQNCFVIDVVADGQKTAEDAGTYMIDVEVVDPDGGGWGARTQFRGGELEVGSVLAGLLASGRDRLEGSTVIAEWDDSDTVRSCVDGGETNLAVASFRVGLHLFSTSGDFWDEANGLGES